MLIKTLALWEDRSDVELTTFLHLPDPFIPKPAKKPAVIICPGGAYMSCPRHGNEGDPIAMAFAIDGFQTFVLEYSVAEKTTTDKTRFPAQIIDLGKAFKTIIENQEEWCVDIEKISILGFSAGAHLCGMYATSWHESFLEQTLKISSKKLKPLAVFLIYGLLDYKVQEEFRKKGKFPSILPKDLNVPVFGEENPTVDKIEEYSPVSRVSENTPPVFLAAAIDDSMVPSIQSLRMAESLHRFKISYELHMFEYGNHGFALGRNFFEPFREDKTKACSSWLRLAKTFLYHRIIGETPENERNPFQFLEGE